MRTKLTLFFCTLALASFFAAAHDFEYNGIYYNMNSDGKSVTVTYDANSYSYNNNNSYYSGSVVIPDNVIHNGVSCPVTAIGEYAFELCGGLTSVTIPNTVTVIGQFAFGRCEGLKSADIPNSVTTFDEYAFYYCKGLTSITIPNSLTTIAEGVFRECTSLTSVTIPNSVSTIGGSAFLDCSGLTSVTIPNSVTSIGKSAFSGCSSLASVTIPYSVSSIGSPAFSSCPGLTSIVVAQDNPNYDSRNDCNAIIETSSNTLITGCKNTTIPKSVTSIGNYAFRGCTSLTSITIPNSVTSIGEWAFAYCYDLTSVTIPNSVTSIGQFAFYACSGLTSITIPNFVASIGDDAFSSCRGLTSIVVAQDNPNYDSRNDCNAIVETSSNTLLTGCKNTTIPNSVTSIGNSAFQGCSGLTSVTIPNSVTTIGEWAFAYCYDLTSVTIPNSVTTIGRSAFSSTAWYNNQPDGLVYAGLVAYIYKGTMPNGTTITLKDGTKGITSECFYFCADLTSVTIPNSVTSIGSWAFRGCTGLMSIYSYILNPKSVELGYNNVFYGVKTSSCKLYVPASSVDLYREANQWKDFKNIVPIEKPGDVNGDGVVSGADVTALYNVLLEGAESGGDADVNGDGVVSGADVTALYNLLLGQ